MKRKLLTTLIFALGAFYASAQFTPGNLAVYRYGNGTAALGNSVTVPVFIDEYTTAGVLVKSRAIPTTDNAGNFKLTGLGRDATGKYVDEGISTLSQDGKYLTIFGYNQVVGGAVPTTTNGLVVGVIAADESYNSTTTLSNDPTAGLGFPRSAVINGTADIWANGSQNGITYTTLGATNAGTRVSTSQDASKSLAIGKNSASGTYSTNNRLYVANGLSNNLPFAEPLPTTSTTFNLTAPYSSTISANQVSIAPVAGRTFIYVADDASNSIRRYYMNNAGTASGPFPVLTDASYGNIKSVTAIYRGLVGTAPQTAVVDVYVTVWGDDGSGTATSKLLTFRDAYTPGSTITTASTAVFATSLTLVATAPANTLFKSVSAVPTGSTLIGTGTLPVSLTGFNGKKSGENVILNWATLSEQNNSYFDVLRSGNGNSNSKINYSFTDKTPEFGANYYHLNQVDFDGKSTASETVAVNFGFAENLSMSVSSSTDNSGLTAVINTPAGINGKINVISISGQQVATADVSLEKGKNYINIPAKLQPGVYVITLSSDKGTTSQKISVK
jgi:hypothetical protein